MKKLLMVTMGLLLLTCAVNAFAQNVTTPSVTTTQTTLMHEVYTYNQYGVAIGGTQRILTTTISTNDEGQEQVTVTETTNFLRSLGGSLKVTHSTTVSDTESDDGSSSHTEGSVDYTYNGNGQLTAAAGIAHTEGDRGRDGEGNDIGTFESDTIENYEIQNGQALRTQTVTTGNNFGPDGEETSEFRETTTYDYDLLAGSWQLMGENSVTTSDGRDGSTSRITKVKTYERDENGVCTGLSQTATGTQTVVNANGGTTTFTMSDYRATSAYDDKAGWYISGETWDWVDNDA